MSNTLTLTLKRKKHFETTYYINVCTSYFDFLQNNYWTIRQINMAVTRVKK